MGPTATLVIIRSLSSCTSAGPPTVTRPLYVMSVSLAPEPAPDRAHRGGSFGRSPPFTVRAPPSRRPASQPSRSAGAPSTVTGPPSAPPPVVQVRPSVDDKVVAGTSA